MGKKLVRQKALKCKMCVLAKYIGNSRFKMIFMYDLENFCISFKDMLFKCKHVCVFFVVLGKTVLNPRQELSH